MHKRHLTSMRMPFTLISTIDDSIYAVQSEDGKRDYQVTVFGDCCEQDCFLKCHECKVCAHMLNCTCPDFLLYAISCKHVHLVQRYMVANHIKATSSYNSTEPEGASTSNYVQQQLQLAHQSLECSSSGSTNDLHSVKTSLENSIFSLLDEVRKVEGIDSLKFIQKKVNALTNTCRSLKNEEPAKLVVRHDHPANKNIETQNKFKFKSVKKKKSKKANKFTKPTNEDREAFKGEVTEDYISVPDSLCKRSLPIERDEPEANENQHVVRLPRLDIPNIRKVYESL